MRHLHFLVILLLLFSALAGIANAQVEENALEEIDEVDDEVDIEEEAQGEPLSPELSYIDMDIRTSSLMELAAWARELGISEGGTREELAVRLRTYYGIEGRSSTAAAIEQRIITIESARTTEYFTLSALDEEYARFTGGVIISLRDGEALHRIQANEILFNRSRNVLSATGGVEYVREEHDTIETFRGESITVNLDNWSSIFLDGASIRSVSGNVSAYRFSGTIISRNAEGVTVLTGAEISNPSNPDALWSLNASKLWLLPGNDWAILNAILKIGNIPVLYVPFFYYPTDEIVFHPVLGGRSREGTFLQTTTYILGRPGVSTISENSITRIFGSVDENTERRLEGIFLRSTGERIVSPNDTRLSLLFDAYVNMGVYFGTELALPASGNLRELSLSFGIGLTRDIFDRHPVTGNPFGAFTPFPYLDGKSEWNTSHLFNMHVPFRYRMDFTGSFNITGGRLNLSLPFYSDPYVDRDFMRRSEVLDWLAMLREGAATDTHDLLGDSGIHSYEWRLNFSYTPVLRNVTPYITNLSITNFSSNLLFNRRDVNNYQFNATVPNPGYAFFFPHRFTIFSVSAVVSGNPYRTAAPLAQQVQAQDIPEIRFQELFISPFINAEDEDENQDNRSANEQYNAGADELSLRPPVLSQRFTLPVQGRPVLSLDYRVNPSTATELQFRSSQANWATQDDINWNEISNVLYRLRGDGSVTLNLSQAGTNFYSASLQLAGTGSWQNFLYLNEEAEEYAGSGGAPSDALIRAARNRTYRETFFTSSYNLTGTVRPFTQNEIWANSNFEYNIGGLLGRTTVDTSGHDPEWSWNFGRFDETDIRNHRVSANFAANIRNNVQNLRLMAVVPPLDSMITADATFRFWISETRISGRIRHPFDDEEMIVDPVSITEILTFPNGSFRQHLVFNHEIDEYTTITSDLRLGGFSALFSASYARPYEFVGTTGGGDIWQLLNDPILAPREFRIGYTQSWNPSNLWQDRFSYSLNLNTSLSFDLQRYTRTRLNFSMGVRSSITRFMDVTFSVVSENNMMFQYFQHLPFFNLSETLYVDREQNILTDLFNSFRFDNNYLRRSSGFKLRSLNFGLIHYMGDWNATLSISTSPYLDRSSFPYSYRFASDISFLIQWIPIGEIKTQIERSQDRFTIN